MFSLVESIKPPRDPRPFFSFGVFSWLKASSPTAVLPMGIDDDDEAAVRPVLVLDCCKYCRGSPLVDRLDLRLDLDDLDFPLRRFSELSSWVLPLLLCLFRLDLEL